MKKVNFKICFRAFLATFCLLFLGVVGVNAQSKNPALASSSAAVSAGGNTSGGNVTGVFAMPQGTFQNNDLAKATVAQQLQTLKTQLQQLTPGSAMANAALVQYAFYQAIEVSLAQGAAVPNAIVFGLRSVNANGGVSNSTLSLLKQDAVALLD